MRLEGIETGDIVEVARAGRRFYALVAGSAPGGLRLTPLDRRVNHHTCRAADVVGHWSRRGRPQTSDTPLRPSPHQLELDTTQRP
jgi:hypothetical protein